MGLLSLLLFLPAAGAALLALLPTTQAKAIRTVALVVTAVDLVLALVLWQGFNPHLGPHLGVSPFQFEETVEWIPAFQVAYHIGVDGLSLPLVVLTSLLGFLAVMVS